MRQRLGQHFLKDSQSNKKVVETIIEALGLRAGETVIEIGPGKGALTMPLLDSCEKMGCRVIAIEKDSELARALELGSRNKELRVITGDALEELSRFINNEIPRRARDDGRPYKIVGNIPYYITGHLLRVIGELDLLPETTVLMIQKEVAERIVAGKGKMNLLAAAVQFWAEPKIIFRLKQKDFDPAPEVESAVIALKTRIKNYGVGIRENYYKTIKIIFKQPRKLLLNNLRDGTEKSKEEILALFKDLNIPENARGQDLDVEMIEKIAERIMHNTGA